MVAVEGDEILQGDQALADAVRAGDRKAENEFVRLYSGRIYAMMLVRTRDREAARELTDDVLMAAVTALRRGSVKDTSRLGAFIHGTSLNVANNFLRSRGRRPVTETLDENLPGLDSVAADGRQDELLAARTGLEINSAP